MKGRKYIQNKKQLSDSEIEAFKDFDAITNRLDGGPEGLSDNGNSMNAFSGLGKGALFVLVAAAITYGVISLLNKTEEVAIEKPVVLVDTTQINTSPRYVIEPPSPIYDVPYESFTIEAQKDAVLKSKRGSDIYILKNTFRDSSGRIVQGKINLKYREFHNPIEVFQCGIPMQYDSAGYSYTFESAGMFELLAEQGGVPLAQELSKPIEVDLVTTNNSLAFNNYYFDAQKGEWSYEDKVKPISIQRAENNSDLSKQPNEIKDLKLADKTKIAKVNKPPKFPKVMSQKYAFEIEYDPMKFPELNRTSVVFQVDEDLSSFSSMYYNVAWESVVLQRSKIADRYTVILKKGAKVIEVQCFPAISEKDFNAYQAQYEKDLAKYNEYIESQKVTLRDSRYTEEEKEVNLLINKHAVQARFSAKRRFVVKNTGFYNCDCPVNLRVDGKQVLAEYKWKNEALKVSKTYNAIGKRNLVLTSPFKEVVNYKPGVKNLFWALTEEQKIAIANPKEFTEIKGKKHTFNMEVYDFKEGLALLKSTMAH